MRIYTCSMQPQWHCFLWMFCLIDLHLKMKVISCAQHYSLCCSEAHLPSYQPLRAQQRNFDAKNCFMLSGPKTTCSEITLRITSRNIWSLLHRSRIQFSKLILFWTQSCRRSFWNKTFAPLFNLLLVYGKLVPLQALMAQQHSDEASV